MIEETTFKKDSEFYARMTQRLSAANSIKTDTSKPTQHMKTSQNCDHDRRNTIKGICSVAAFSLLPHKSYAVGSEQKLRIAKIGVTGRGRVSLKAILDLPNTEVTALVDVDSNFLKEAAETVPGAKTFQDYRVLFEEMKDGFDAVIVSTPDHMHYPISMAAMAIGKHVYCEKPLAHNVKENRELKLMAEKTGLVTQLGTQTSSSISHRMTVEYIQNGIIGKVSEVHVWTRKSWGLAAPNYPHPISNQPANLDWNLWLGVAQNREYRPETFHPKAWRRLLDFGTGTLGDMGAHIFDAPYKALKLGAPLSTRSHCKNSNNFAHSQSVKTEYNFAPTAYTTEKLKWVWYDGKYAPPVIDGVELEPGAEMPREGCILVGEKGILMMPHKHAPQTFPEELLNETPKLNLPPRDHHGEWVDACLGKGKTNSPFSYGGPLCEVLQIGVVASRFPGETLEWDDQAMQFTNKAEANQFLSREYREF